MVQILFLSILCFQSIAYSAACCGGGSTVPSLVTTDDRAQLSTSFSYSQIKIDSVDGAGIWFKNADHQMTKTLKFDYAYVLDSDIQFGCSIPLVQKQFQDQTYSGLADVQAAIGYEYLPEREYNLFKPKAFVYGGLIFPTGFSKYKSMNGGVDARGQGLWGISLGHVAVKNYLQFDLMSLIDLHHYFNQDLKLANNESLKIRQNGLGGQINFAAGYNTLKSRWGFSAAWFYEDRITNQQQNIQDTGYIEKYGQISLSYSYMLTELAGVTFNYSDQTIIGTPESTSLGQTLSVQLNQRWTR